MPKLYSDNALMSKVRTLYGVALDEHDYTQLLQKKSVGEVAAYLKRETGYAPQLIEVREELIHRGQLEALVRRRKLDIYVSLSKYSYADDAFLRLFALRNEAEWLMFCLRLLVSGTSGQRIAPFPQYLARYLSIDAAALGMVQSYDDLLLAVRKSNYYAVLGPFRPLAGGSIDLPGCERALMQHYFDAAGELVRTAYRGDTRSELGTLLRHQAQLHNLMVIYRMKRFFDSSAESIRRLLLDVKAPALSGGWDALLDLKDLGELRARFQRLRMFRAGRDVEDSEGFERMARLNSLDKSRKTLRFSTQPIVVLMSFMSLLDIETANIVSVIEGIRYHVPPDEIKALLVL